RAPAGVHPTAEPDTAIATGTAVNSSGGGMVARSLAAVAATGGVRGQGGIADRDRAAADVYPAAEGAPSGAAVKGFGTAVEAEDGVSIDALTADGRVVLHRAATQGQDSVGVQAAPCSTGAR